MTDIETQPQPVPPSKNASNEKLLTILCHLSVFIGLGLILPLIMFLVTREDGGPVPAHAKETLNFHLSLLIYSVVAGLLILVVIGIFLLFAIAIAGLVFAVIGAIKASKEELYQYPLTIRLVK